MNWVNKIIKIQFLVIGGGSILLHGNEESFKQATSETKNSIHKSLSDNNYTKMNSRRRPTFPGANEVELLRSLLDASPERLKIMKKTIERVESMSPQKKKEIKKRLRQLKDSPPHIRADEIGRLKRRYEQLTQHWASLNPKDQQNEIKAFRALSFPEREKYFKSVIQYKKGQ